jgi:shikimate dehydrogenase
MRTYGLVGFPLEHSFSKGYFNDKFKREGIDAHYENFPVDNIQKLPQIINGNPDLCGLNITIPYKERVIPYLNKIETVAKKIGAVNTVKISRIGNSPQLAGFNTDVYGFELSLKPLIRSWHKQALVLGTGGASKSVIYVLDKLGIRWIQVSRHSRSIEIICYSDITPEIIHTHHMIINTTPLGMYPNSKDYPDIPYQLLDQSYLLYDLVYNPELTMFMKLGADKGAVVKNGLDMLTLQAQKAWEIWNDSDF